MHKFLRKINTFHTLFCKYHAKATKELPQLRQPLKRVFRMVVDSLSLGKGSLSYGHGLHAEKASEIRDDLKEYLIREYGVPAEQISVTVNGIDVLRYMKFHCRLLVV